MVHNEKYAWMHSARFMDSLTKMRDDAEKFSERIKQSIIEDKERHSEFLQQGHGKHSSSLYLSLSFFSNIKCTIS